MENGKCDDMAAGDRRRNEQGSTVCMIRKLIDEEAGNTLLLGCDLPIEFLSYSTGNMLYRGRIDVSYMHKSKHYQVMIECDWRTESVVAIGRTFLSPADSWKIEILSRDEETLRGFAKDIYSRMISVSN